MYGERSGRPLTREPIVPCMLLDCTIILEALLVPWDQITTYAVFRAIVLLSQHISIRAHEVQSRLLAVSDHLPPFLLGCPCSRVPNAKGTTTR